MKNIIFIAPPAAGKGTQSELLVKKYGFAHISTGDLLREEVEKKTDLGLKIADNMQKGILISNEIVSKLLKNRLSLLDNSTGYILDGYPRKYEQCKLLDDIMQELNMKVDAVLYLDMDEKTAMHRALGRITCPKCGRGYNKYESAMKPKKDMLCDDCNVELTSRSDDNEESFKLRFRQYIEEVEPILNYYKELGILKIIDNSGTPESTFNKIEEVI